MDDLRQDLTEVVKLLVDEPEEVHIDEIEEDDCVRL
jgi:predicted RNA-binding protein YlqC (UPF0109 family)